MLASPGCGNPTALAELRPGETVLDSAPVAASTCSSPPSAWARDKTCQPDDKTDKTCRTKRDKTCRTKRVDKTD